MGAQWRAWRGVVWLLGAAACAVFIGVRQIPSGVVVLGLSAGLVTSLFAIPLVLIWRMEKLVDYSVVHRGVLAGLVSAFVLPPGWRLGSVVLGPVLGAVIGLATGRGLRFTRTRLPGPVTASLTVAATVVLGALAALLPAPSSVHFGVDRSWYLFPVTFGAAHGLTFALFPLVFAAVFVVGAGKWGLGMRALADNPGRATTLALPRTRLADATWAASGALSGLAGTLALGVFELGRSSRPGFGLLLLAVAGLVAAQTDSFRATAAYSTLIGLAWQLSTWLAGSTPAPELLLVGVTVVGLVTWSYPRGERQTTRIRRPLSGIHTFGAAPPIVLLVAAGTIWLIDPVAAGQTVGFGLVVVSVCWVYRFSHRIDLGAWAVAGAGAVVAGLGLDGAAGLPLAFAAGAAAGLIIALVVSRLPAPGYSLATLSFGVAVQAVGAGYAPRTISEQWFGFNTSFGVELLIVAAFGALVIAATHSTESFRLGDRLKLVRDHPARATMDGISVPASRALVLVVGGALAALGGYVWAVSNASVDLAEFGVSKSFVTATAAIFGFVASTEIAIIAAAVFVALHLVLPDAGAELTVATAALLFAAATRWRSDAAD